MSTLLIHMYKNYYTLTEALHLTMVYIDSPKKGAESNMMLL